MIVFLITSNDFRQTGWFHWSDIFPNIHTAGLYTCKAENEAGENEENVRLHMIGKKYLCSVPNFITKSLHEDELYAFGVF